MKCTHRRFWELTAAYSTSPLPFRWGDYGHPIEQRINVFWSFNPAKVAHRALRVHEPETADINPIPLNTFHWIVSSTSRFLPLTASISRLADRILVSIVNYLKRQPYRRVRKTVSCESFAVKLSNMHMSLTFFIRMKLYVDEKLK